MWSTESICNRNTNNNNNAGLKPQRVRSCAIPRRIIRRYFFPPFSIRRRLLFFHPVVVHDERVEKKKYPDAFPWRAPANLRLFFPRSNSNKKNMNICRPMRPRHPLSVCTTTTVHVTNDDTSILKAC